MSMNLSTLAHLIRSDVTTCDVAFTGGSAKHYTFKITNALADAIHQKHLETGEGVNAVANTCNGLRIVRVVDIHAEPQIDPEDDVHYEWVFQLVDETEHARQVAFEQSIASKLRTRRKLSQRQQALAALGIADPEEFVASLAAPEK